MLSTDAHAVATPILSALRAKLGVDWPAISAAQQRTAERRRLLTTALSDAVPDDTSLVVFGSLARGEVTTGSDVDWTLLVDGQAHAGHLDAALEIERRLVALEMTKPGREGTFGGLTFGHDLVHYIGGGADTNRNTTQRILLLLESLPIGPSGAYMNVLRQLLKRYIEEDFGWVHRANPSNVPRFLQNDIARYWRTVAVDFAYKRRERGQKGWALRTVKLRLSRKLTYAAGLVACYSCAAIPAGQANTDGEQPTLPLLSHLETYLRQPPLEMVAAAVEPYFGVPQIPAAAQMLFTAYDDFLALLDDDGVREALDELKPEDAPKSLLYERARNIGHRFQRALDALFLDRSLDQMGPEDDDSRTELSRLTRIYGVF